MLTTSRDQTPQIRLQAVGLSCSLEDGINDCKIHHTTCYKCGNQGHVRRNCPVRGATRTPTGGNGKDGVNNKTGNEGDATANGEDYKPQWCPLHMTSNHDAEECRVLKKHSRDERANWVGRLGHPVVRDTRKQPPAICFNAVEPLNTKTLSKTEHLRPLAPTNEPVTSFDCSGLFDAFAGADGEGIGGSTVMSDEEAPERLGLCGKLNNVHLMTSRVLSTLCRALAIVAAIHYI